MLPFFKSLSKDISSRSLIILFNQFSVLLLIYILANRVNFVYFGLISIGFLFAQFSWVLADYGINNYCVEIWKKIKNTQQQNKFISKVLLLNFFILVIYSTLLFVIIFFKFISFPIDFFFLILPSIFMGGIFPIWFFYVKKSAYELIMPTFFGRVFFILMVYFFVEDSRSSSWAFVAQGITLSLITFYSFYKIIRYHHFRFYYVNIYELLHFESLCRPFFFNSFINNQINTLWAMGLSFFSGPSAMAIYNLGDQFYRAGGVFSNLIAQTIRTHYLGFNFKRIRKIITVFIILYFLLSMIIIFLSNFFVTNLFNSTFLPAIQIIKIMTVAWFVHAIIKLLNYPIFGEIVGPGEVNKINKWIYMLHMFGFFTWYFFCSTVASMAIIYCAVISLHLCLLVSLILIKR